MPDEQWVRAIRDVDRTAPDSDGETAVMSAAELRCVIDYLGIAQDDLARLIGVEERAVRRWLQGPVGQRANRIPTKVRHALEDLEVMTAAAVGQMVDALQDASEVGVIVYRADQEMWADRPDLSPLPARWWRHVVMRAATEVSGVAIAYRAPPRGR